VSYVAYLHLGEESGYERVSGWPYYRRTSYYIRDIRRARIVPPFGRP
jgi:hypothetical protein